MSRNGIPIDGESYVEINVSDLLMLKSKEGASAPGRTKLWLVAYLVRAFQGGPEHTIDCLISNEPTPGWPGREKAPIFRTIILADAEGRDFEHAASKIKEAVDKHPHLKWVQRMKAYQKQVGS